MATLSPFAPPHLSSTQWQRRCRRLIKNSSTLFPACSPRQQKQQQQPPPRPRGICCCYADETNGNQKKTQGNSTGGIQLYSQIERIITETARQSQDGWGVSGDWTEIQGAWVLRPRNTRATSVIHFIGGAFVGAAPQLTYRLFLERLSEKGVLVIATPFASGFDHFLIADEAQFKFDSCLRLLKDTVCDLPIFGVGHSLGSVVHLLIGSRYAIERSGNVLMAFNNKEASQAIPLFSPVIVPMTQNFGPLLYQLTSSPTLRTGVIPDVPPTMANVVNRGGELLADLTVGTPWEAVTKQVGNTLGADSGPLRAQISKDVDMLVEVITSWMASNSGPSLLQP